MRISLLLVAFVASAAATDMKVRGDFHTTCFPT